ncbi:putative TPR repeat-containing protein [Vitis vinifera]|uniref:Putative TPR repeat-containing protein n=1 Tax=Vitis vinifera TaxID=29760 RepID=A0A438ERJ1_VITVI|nr:putative TPR repeat-containing protein [Vitis vinifera]
MATRGSRSEKVKRIFQQFDGNCDGGLNRDEMADLVVAVNPRVKFSDAQISAILDEGKSAASSSSIADERVLEPHKKQRTAAWAASPNHGIVFDETWKVVDDLEILIKRLKAKQVKDGKMKGDNFDAYSDPGWSRELGPSAEMSEKRVVWEESGHDYALFVKELGVLRTKADGARSREEAFDGHMAIGRVLYEHQLFKEALIHVNLGIALEGEGMVMSACEHYREAAILCPTHFRALKLLGSALFGVGEYRAAVKALEEAIFMKADYADAHCDLASALHAMGEGEKAIPVFQKAIDLKPGHVDALYNLGGLYMDMGRFQRASEMYTRVLAVCPNHWRAQLNKAVSLLGAGEAEEAKKALKEALKMTNRVELHDAISHLKQLQKKKVKPNGSANGEGAFSIVEPSKFKTVGEKTALRPELANTLEIRAFQRITRLRGCDVDLLKKEMTENDVPVSYSGGGVPEKSIRKPNLEVILRRLLQFLKPETFQGAVKAINERILSVLDETGSGRVDLGMFFFCSCTHLWWFTRQAKTGGL